MSFEIKIYEIMDKNCSESKSCTLCIAKKVCNWSNSISCLLNKLQHFLMMIKG